MPVLAIAARGIDVSPKKRASSPKVFWTGWLWAAQPWRNHVDCRKPHKNPAPVMNCVQLRATKTFKNVWTAGSARDGYSWGGQVTRYDPYSSYGYGYDGYPYGSTVGSQGGTYVAGYGYPYGYSDNAYWMSGKGTKRQKRKAHR